MAEISRREDGLRGLGIEGYDPLVHQNVTKEITRLEGAMDRRGRILAMLQREPTLEAERDLLVDELQKIRETLLSLRVERDEAGYDDAGRQRLEAALETLRPVRDEYISLTDRLSYEPEIIARRDAASREQAAERDRVTRVKTGLAALGWSGEAAPDVRAVLNSTEESLRVCTAQKTRISERISRTVSVMEQLRALQDEIARLRDELELVRATRKVVAEYIIYLMQVVRSRIEGDVSRILGEITAGRYDRVLLDEDFNLLVRDIDNDYPVERFSGGEQDDIAVALRIALSRYLAALHRVPESTFLIFDEIFGSQDEERRNSLLLELRTQEAYFPQILLISHIPEMQGEFANTLLVELGSDQASRITEAVQ
jgi:exonuclease SbcC